MTRIHLRQAKQTPPADQGLVYARGEKFTTLSFRFLPNPQEIIAFVNALAPANSSPVIDVRRALICEMYLGNDLDQALEGNVLFALNFERSATYSIARLNF